jgi:hypothetical protein
MPAKNGVFVNLRNLFIQQNMLEYEISLKKLGRFEDINDNILNDLPVDAEQAYPLAYDVIGNGQNHSNYLRVKYQLALYSSILQFCIKQCQNYKTFKEGITISNKLADVKAQKFMELFEKLQSAVDLYAGVQKDSISLLQNFPLKLQTWFETESSAKRRNNMVKEIYEKDIYATRNDIELYRINLLSYYRGGH